jgi:cell division septation protein DedD
MLTPDERDVMNAQRRAGRQELTIDQRNASQRARRQRDRTTLLAKRNAKALAKRKTPCAESIAMMCPLGVSSISTYPAVPNTSPAMDADDSPHSSPSAVTHNYAMETDGNYSSLLHFLFSSQLLTGTILLQVNTLAGHLIITSFTMT